MITIENLCSIYSNTEEGLNQYSTVFKEGVYGLFGKNGAGKTTLFRNLTGALFPQKGKVTVLGENPVRRSPHFFKEFFIIPEDPYYPDLSVSTYIDTWSMFYPNFNMDILKQLFQEWEVPQKKNLWQMSQGQKKKFLIAFAIAAQTKILFCDEPTNGLDITAKQIFKNIITEFIQDHQLVIISTHQVKDHETLVDNISLIDDGRHLGTFSRKELNQKLISSIEPDDDPNALYSMKSQGQFMVLKEKHTEEPSQLDLEVFFTAFLARTEKILNVVTPKENS